MPLSPEELAQSKAWTKFLDYMSEDLLQQTLVLCQTTYTRPAHRLPTTRDKWIVAVFATALLLAKLQTWAWSF